MARGPGTVIKQLLSKFYIKPIQGCGCYALADEMDKIGYSALESQIEQYTDKMVESIKDWRKGISTLIPQPPRSTVQSLIKFGIEQSKSEDQQERNLSRSS